MYVYMPVTERMHLLTFLELRQPGRIFRGFVLLGQGVFFK